MWGRSTKQRRAAQRRHRSQKVAHYNIKQLTGRFHRFGWPPFDMDSYHARDMQRISKEFHDTPMQHVHDAVVFTAVDFSGIEARILASLKSTLKDATAHYVPFGFEMEP